MTYQIGLILTGLGVIALWLLSEWWASGPMRRRRRKREAYERYLKLIGNDVKYMPNSREGT